eukprot:gene30364-39597_t
MKSAPSIGALSNISLPSSLSASVSLYSGAGPSFQQSSSTSSMANQSNSNNILDKNLIRPKFEVSLSAFSFLFSELVQYNQNRVDSIHDLEKKLESSGYSIGTRVVELVSCRDHCTRRETRVVTMLQYIQNVIWKYLFNKAADNLERSTENDDEYMIHEHSPITNAFVSVPADMGQLNCAAFIAGILAGILDAAKFSAKVTAHLVPAGEGSTPGSSLSADRTVFLIKFSSEVMSRERKLGSSSEELPTSAIVPALIGLDSSYQRPSSKRFHISSQALLARKKTRERTVERNSEEAENNTDDEADDSKIFADAVKSLQRSLSNPSRTLSSTSTDDERTTVTSSVRDLKGLDIKELTDQANKIKSLLQVSDYKLDVLICSSLKMRSLNREWRGVSKDTDVLSMRFNEFVSPGVFAEDPSTAVEKHLGDLVLSPSYIIKQCERDQHNFQKLQQMEAGILPTTAAAADLLQEMEADAGVSREMGQGYFTLQERAPLFLIHGILHLLGYDHENDEDFQTMTKEEERVLRAMTNSAPSPSVPDQAAPVATVTSKSKKRNVRSKEDPKATGHRIAASNSSTAPQQGYLVSVD